MSRTQCKHKKGVLDNIDYWCMEDQISNKTTFKYKLELFYTFEKIWSLTFFAEYIIRIFIFLNFSITGCWTWSIFVTFYIDTYALCAYFLSQGRSFLFYMIFVDYQWCIFYQDLIPLIFSWQHHMWLPEMANFEQQISLYLSLWYQSTVWGHTLV